MTGAIVADVRALPLVLLLAPAVALPCSIVLRVATQLAPADGATNVPLNAELRFLPRGEVRWSLVDADGTTVEANERKRGSMVTLRPAALLKPGRQYMLTVSGVGELREDIETVTFTTGAETDIEPPAPPGRPSLGSVPKALPSPFSGSGSCSSPSGYDKALWPGPADTQTPASEVLIEAAFVSDGVVEFQPQFAVSCARVAAEGGCLQTWVPNKSDPPMLRARAVDWAGNTSELSEPEPVRGCGCSAGEGTAALLAAALLLRRFSGRRSWRRSSTRRRRRPRGPAGPGAARSSRASDPASPAPAAA